MKKKILFVALLMIFIIPFAVLAWDGDFALSLGETEISNTKNMENAHPVAYVQNNRTGVDGQLAISLEKKNLIGYSNEYRIQKWMRNVSSYTFVFSDKSYSGKKCRLVFLNNAMNGSGSLNGYYDFYSQD